MFCSNCGKQVDNNAKFCWSCGQELIRITQKQPQKAAEPVRQTKTAAQPQTMTAETAEPVRAKAPEPVKMTEPEPVRMGGQPYASAGFSEEPVQVKEMTAEGPKVVPVRVGGAETVVQVSANEEDYDYRSLMTEKPTGIRSIHVFDFLIRMTEKENIPVLIYLAVNVLIIGGVFTALFVLPFGWGVLAGLIVYVASVIVALSPIGEFILRIQTGCKKITSVDDINRLEPLFREVYYKAKKANPTISSDVHLFINEDESPNAFATGRKTMCVTRGLLNMSDEQIKATMGHEFGHLAHKDTDRILVISVGNTIISIIFMIIQICIIIMNVIIAIFSIFSDHGFLISIFNAIATFVSLIVLRGLMKLWTAFGVALCMKTSRGNEYQADEFSLNLGYGSELCTVLASFGDAKPKGLFASLANSHPQNSDRIARLVELGAVYNC